MKTNADMENVDCKSTLKQDTEGGFIHSPFRKQLWRTANDETA